MYIVWHVHRLTCTSFWHLHRLTFTSFHIYIVSRSTDDPTEHNNLADQMPEMVAKLKERMAEYKKKYVPPNYPHHDPNSNPQKYGGAWSPGWCWVTSPDRSYDAFDPNSNPQGAEWRHQTGHVMCLVCGTFLCNLLLKMCWMRMS